MTYQEFRSNFQERRPDIYAGKQTMYMQYIGLNHIPSIHNNMQTMSDDSIMMSIAHALSKICRWGGHIKNEAGILSVAQHSIDVFHQTYSTDPLVKYTSLIHDAVEFITSDRINPLKTDEEYKVENDLVEKLSKRLQFIYPFPDDVKIADLRSLEIEYDTAIIADKKILWTPSEAKARYIDVYLRTRKQAGIENLI